MTRDRIVGLPKGKWMNRQVLVEGIFLLAIATVSLIEGLRLIIVKDPRVIYDKIGPGSFILFLSFALTAAGVAHLVINHKKIRGEKLTMSQGAKMRVLSMSVTLAIYIFLIDILGYYVATVFFLLTEFRLVGVRSWLLNVILTVAVTAVFYIIFAVCCSLVFPKGILF